MYTSVDIYIYVCQFKINPVPQFKHLYQNLSLNKENLGAIFRRESKSLMNFLT